TCCTGAGCHRGIGESPYMGDTGTASQPVPAQQWRQPGGPPYARVWPAGCANTGTGRGRMRDARGVPHGGLPALADLFVRRDDALAALSGMLASPQTRLVTLTGPPGIGKTRLAVACAVAYTERSGCDAVFVDLAPVRDPALVMAELAQAVGVEPRGGTGLAGQLAGVLGNEERRLVPA